MKRMAPQRFQALRGFYFQEGLLLTETLFYITLPKEKPNFRNTKQLFDI
jgi:hypothetical protein